MNTSKKPNSEILFRTKFDLGISGCSDTVLRRKETRFIVEMNNIYGKYSCQSDTYYDIEQAYKAYENIVEQLKDRIIEEGDNNASKNRKKRSR